MVAATVSVVAAVATTKISIHTALIERRGTNVKSLNLFPNHELSHT